jgi:hypothetical protein
VTKIEVLLVCAFDDDSITVTNHVAWNGYCNRGDAPMFCSITTMQWSQFHSLKNCNKIMRLVLAAAFLANALPVASKRDSTISLAPESHKSLTIKPKKLLIHQKFGEVFTKIQGSRKSQILKNVASDAVQCDPKAVDADVGILSCGLEQYCMESKDSDLGGVCVDRDTPVVPDRKLFADGYYVDVAAYYCSSAGDWTDHLSCDCSKFDNNSKTGSVKCALSESYCFEDASCETCVKLTAEFKMIMQLIGAMTSSCPTNKTFASSMLIILQLQPTVALTLMMSLATPVRCSTMIMHWKMRLILQRAQPLIAPTRREIM